jgi:3',5'-nucleoside bisphosphate phosphatase
MTQSISRRSAASAVDLHIHTTASDGVYSPSDIVRLAAEIGLKTIAISDHDTVGGIEEALAATKGLPLEVIPAVELSCEVAGGEVHILGYYVDCHHPPLLEMLRNLRDARFGRARKMVEKLAGLGMPLSWDRVQEIAQGESVGRPHIARAMLEKDYISTTTEAFNLYIGRNGPAYVERYKLTPVDAIQLIRAAAGLPVFAHPDTNHSVFNELGTLIRGGLVGLEAYYADFSETQRDELAGIATKLGLVATGGTDFHGFAGPGEVFLGGVYVPEQAVERLKGLKLALDSSHPKAI